MAYSDSTISLPPPIPAEDDLFLDSVAAAAILGLSVRALESWRSRGIGPAFIRLGANTVRYRAKVLRDWMLERETQPAANARIPLGG